MTPNFFRTTIPTRYDDVYRQESCAIHGLKSQPAAVGDVQPQQAAACGVKPKPAAVCGVQAQQAAACGVQLQQAEQSSEVFHGWNIPRLQQLHTQPSGFWPRDS